MLIRLLVVNEPEYDTKRESNELACQMAAMDSMVFFLNFLFFHQLFLCEVFGQRVGGFRQAVVLEKCDL